MTGVRFSKDFLFLHNGTWSVRKFSTRTYLQCLRFTHFCLFTSQFTLRTKTVCFRSRYATAYVTRVQSKLTTRKILNIIMAGKILSLIPVKFTSSKIMYTPTEERTVWIILHCNACRWMKESMKHGNYAWNSFERLRIFRYLTCYLAYKKRITLSLARVRHLNRIHVA